MLAKRHVVSSSFHCLIPLGDFFSLCPILKNNFVYIFIYIFTFGCVESLLLCRLFSSCGEQGIFSSCHAQVSHCGGFFCCAKLFH